MPSNWTRLVGEGQPTDYSAGSSVAGDYTGQPVLRLVESPGDAAPEPPAAPEAIPDAAGPFSWPEPSTVVRQPRISFAEGLRLLARFAASKEQKGPDQ